jgi:hypothetical protein
MAHELKQTKFVDAYWRTLSLDESFYVMGLDTQKAVVLVDHTPAKPDELEIRKDDVVTIPTRWKGNKNDYVNGYLNVFSERLKKAGLVPFYKIKMTF